MTDPAQVVSLLVALEFVAMSAVVLLLVLLDVAAPIIPLLFVFLLALHLYHS